MDLVLYRQNTLFMRLVLETRAQSHKACKHKNLLSITKHCFCVKKWVISQIYVRFTLLGLMPYSMFA